MTTTRNFRIAIEDLPPVTDLSEEEQARILGAGKRPRAQLGVEVLEGRELMAANLLASLSNGQLQIEGTEQADNILVRPNADRIEVVNGATNTTVFSALTQQVRQIAVQGLAGDDLIRIDPSIRVAAFVSGDGGTDRLVNGQGA